MNIKKLTKRTESYIFIALLLLCLLIQFRSGQFFTGNNLVDLSRSLTIPAMFCVGELLVLISGGIDVSFPSIAALSMYVVCTRLTMFSGNIFLLLAAGTVLGLVMGALNGFLVAKFRFPAMIVTLGTSSLFTGVLMGGFAAHESPIPDAMAALGKSKLFSASNAELGISSDMPVTVLFLILLVAVVWFLLRYTKLGRGIYAIGGDVVSAQRAGYRVFAIQMFIYCFCGALAGFTGVTRAAMMQNCAPTNLNGMEMTCIAACVLGGASVTGGTGTLTGTILGIALMTVMSNSLILIGIPTYWQRVFTGAIILIGTGVSAYQVLSSQKKLASKQIA